MRNARKARVSRSRGGFTLIELMVSVVLLSVGVLALASTSGLVMRMMGGASQQVRAATIATSRFETLRSLQCSSIGSGAATTPGITERWAVSLLAARTYDVADTVTLVSMSSRRPVVQAYRSMVRC